MIVSPGAMCGVSRSIVWSTGAPDGTISHTTRGVLSCAIIFSSESAPTAPFSTTRLTAAGSRSTPTTRCPPRTSRSVMNAPIFPSPIIPSSIFLSSLRRHSQCRQIPAQLRHILELNRVHSHFFRAFQIQSAIINQDAFRWVALGDLQRQAENSAVRLSHSQVTRTEKRAETISQVKRPYAVLIDFERLVVQRRMCLPPRLRQLLQKIERLRHRLRLLKHKLLKLLLCERPLSVENCPLHVFVQRCRAALECVQQQLMAILKIRPVEMKFLDRLLPRPAVPPVRQDDSAVVPE